MTFKMGGGRGSERDDGRERETIETGKVPASEKGDEVLGKHRGRKGTGGKGSDGNGAGERRREQRRGRREESARAL